MLIESRLGKHLNWRMEYAVISSHVRITFGCSSLCMYISHVVFVYLFLVKHVSTKNVRKRLNYINPFKQIIARTHMLTVVIGFVVVFV